MIGRRQIRARLKAIGIICPTLLLLLNCWMSFRDEHRNLSSSRRSEYIVDFEKTLQTVDWDIPIPENLNIMFIGDSISRFQYLSLCHYLKFGEWIKPLQSPNPVLEYEHGGWNNFYENTNSMLAPYEQCDCCRADERDPDYWFENRFYRDPEKNNYVSYIQKPSSEYPFTSHWGPNDVYKPHDLEPMDKDTVSLNVIEFTKWEDFLQKFVYKMPIKPDVIIFNEGLWPGSNVFRDDPAAGLKIVKTMKRAGITTVYKTTTKVTDAREEIWNRHHNISGTFLYEETICKITDYCLDLSYTKDMPNSFRSLDGIHFIEPAYAFFNMQLLKLLSKKRFHAKKKAINEKNEATTDNSMGGMNGFIMDRKNDAIMDNDGTMDNASDHAMDEKNEGIIDNTMGGTNGLVSGNAMDEKNDGTMNSVMGGTNALASDNTMDEKNDGTMNSAMGGTNGLASGNAMDGTNEGIIGNAMDEMNDAVVNNAMGGTNGLDSDNTNDGIIGSAMDGMNGLVSGNAMDEKNDAAMNSVMGGTNGLASDSAMDGTNEGIIGNAMDGMNDAAVNNAMGDTNGLVSDNANDGIIDNSMGGMNGLVSGNTIDEMNDAAMNNAMGGTNGLASDNAMDGTNDAIVDNTMGGMNGSVSGNAFYGKNNDIMDNTMGKTNGLVVDNTVYEMKDGNFGSDIDEKNDVIIDAAIDQRDNHDIDNAIFEQDDNIIETTRGLHKKNGIIDTSAVIHDEAVMPIPENLNIMFIGDSVSRFQYLSLCHFLKFGEWIKPDTFPNPVIEKEHGGWNEFYKNTKEMLAPYEECDCSRTDENPKLWFENRFYHDPEKNNYISYISKLSSAFPFKAHWDPTDVHNPHELDPLTKDTVMEGVEEIYMWQDFLDTYVSRMNPEPDVIIFNEGIWPGPNIFKDEEKATAIVESMEAAGFITVYKTTTKVTDARQKEWEARGTMNGPGIVDYESHMCKITDYCLDLSHTEHTDDALYDLDGIHFKEPMYSKFNLQLLELLGDYQAGKSARLQMKQAKSDEFEKTLEETDWDIPIPENLNIMFIGDSISRYEYFSLCHYVKFGEWVQSNVFPNPLWERDHSGWIDFFKNTNELLTPHEQCDCARSDGASPKLWFENRFYRDPFRNNTLSYIHKFSTPYSFKSHWDPDQVYSPHNLAPFDPVTIMSGAKVFESWEDFIINFISEMPLKPDIIVFNEGLWRDSRTFTDPREGKMIVDAMRRAGITTIYKTTTKFKNLALEKSWDLETVNKPGVADYEQKMCEMTDYCMDLSYTEDVPESLYTNDGVHFSPQLYAYFNLQLLDLLSSGLQPSLAKSARTSVKSAPLNFWEQES